MYINKIFMSLEIVMIKIIMIIIIIHFINRDYLTTIT
jgi:hypothetical protein